MDFMLLTGQVLIDVGAHGYEAGDDGGDCERWPTVGDALEELRAAEIRDLAGPDGQDRDQEVENAAGVGAVFHFAAFPFSRAATRASSAVFFSLSSRTALTRAASSGRSERVSSSAFSRFLVFLPSISVSVVLY